MKKTAILIAVVSAFAFASCKKDRTCTCTEVTTSGSSSTTETEVVTIIDATKADAKKMCVNSTRTDEFMGFTTTTTKTCELK